MIRYVIRRIILMIPVLIGVSLLVFALQYLAPGDPAQLMLGEDASEEQIHNWREKNGLNDPFIVQYGKFVWNIVAHRSFGTSWRTGQEITHEIVSRWPTTFLLAMLSMVVSTVFGVLFGIIGALFRGKWPDTVATVFGMLGLSVPAFWFALMLILVVAVNMKLLPVSGFYGPEYWILPTIALAVQGAARLLRVARSSVLDNVNQDFVRTARSKGQTERVIVMHHILGNAWIPIINGIGAWFASNMGGAMVLEQIFAIPGLGSLMVTSINSRDYPQLRASVLLVAVTVSVVNLLVDIAYAAVDPRIKASFKSSGKQMKFLRKKEGAA